MMFAMTYDEIPYILLLDVFAGGTLAVLLSLLLGGHLRNLLIGQTPLEQKFGVVVENEKSYYERFQEAFGPPSVQWLIPMPLAYDAVSPFMWEQYRKEGKKEE